MEKVSVIIPAYNSSNWIVQTIRSVQEQCYSNLEIIVVDDGSVDQTRQLLEAIDEPRLIILACEHRGTSAARNLGIERATGEFITFLDSDDLWSSDMIESHVAALQNRPTAGVAYCWRSKINEEDELIGYFPTAFHEGNIYSSLITNSILSCGSLLARSEVIKEVGKFDERIEFGEDSDYWLRLAFCTQFVLVPKYQFMYRKHANSTTAELYSNNKKIERYQVSRLLIKENLTTLDPTNKITWQIAYELQTAYIYLAQYIQQGRPYQHNICKAKQNILDAIHIKPKILFSSRTGALILIWLIAKIFSHRTASSIVTWLREQKQRLSMLWLMTKKPKLASNFK